MSNNQHFIENLLEGVNQTKYQLMKLKPNLVITTNWALLK